MYLITNEIKDSTLIQIGKYLHILPEDAVVTEENVDKVVNATWFYMDINLPSYATKGDISDSRFRLEVYTA